MEVIVASVWITIKDEVGDLMMTMVLLMLCDDDSVW